MSKTKDIRRIATLINNLVDNITCFHCCKYYVEPDVAICGHTLCHCCWYERHTCPYCANALDRKTLKRNTNLQKLTKQTRELVNAFEKLYNIEFDDLVSDFSIIDTEEQDNDLENCFPKVQSNLEQCIKNVHPQIELCASKKLSHTFATMSPDSVKVVHKPFSQDDWDRIEVMSESEDSLLKNKENPANTMNDKQFIVNKTKYTADNPRRSNRKRNSNNRYKSKDQDETAVVTTSKAKQHWSSVKKMKKEFSKLNNKNKLNVSIEMINKSKNVTCKPDLPFQESLSIIQEEEILKKSNITENNRSNVSKVTPNINETNLINNNNISDNINGPKIIFSQMSSLAIESLENENNKEEKPKVVIHNIEDMNEDIQITIKIGNTSTNILMQQKQNTAHLKVYKNCEVQTDLDLPLSFSDNLENAHPEKNDDIEINIDDNVIKITPKTIKNIKHVSSKIDCANQSKNSNIGKTPTQDIEPRTPKKSMDFPSTTTRNIENNFDVMHNRKTVEIIDENKVYLIQNEIFDYVENVNEQDIFHTNTESDVQLLKVGNNTPSEILKCTVKSNKTQNQIQFGKREREDNDDKILPIKKLKVMPKENTPNKNLKENNNEMLSTKTSDNNEAIISQVFASIDKVIEKSLKHNKKTVPEATNMLPVNKIIDKKHTQQVTVVERESFIEKEHQIEKFSENVFSLYDNKENNIVHGTETQNNIDNLLTSGICEKFTSINTPEVTKNCGDSAVQDLLCTPMEDNDDSDKSVVEDTPQKTISFINNKHRCDGQNQITNEVTTNYIQSVVESDIKSCNVISCENSTIKDIRESNLDTPPTITKFVNHISHKSTPLAKKSLNFDKGEYNDSDQTLCPTSVLIAKTTQEKELMAEAFDKSLSPVKSVNRQEIKKFCVAGSCLTAIELKNVKLLCNRYNWKFLDKYSKELTHLVVGVDDENKSQRSVKYMCAVASNKWIVSYAWVEKCLSTKDVVNEEPYEALDGSGESGPQRSRTAKEKLFHGIMFYCLPPFSILDVDTLKFMLESAGGEIGDDFSDVRVTGEKPAFVLAEPEQTQEVRFTVMAMQFNIVPINIEWALNCLGSYSLTTIRDQLLCQTSLLPKEVLQWPPILIDSESD